LSSTTGGTTYPVSGIYSKQFEEITPFFALADAGYRFKNWMVNGGFSILNPIALLFTKSYTVVAEFIAQFTLTIPESDNGTTNPGPGDHVYDVGTSLVITAAPIENFEFVKFTEDGVDKFTNPLTVVMNAAKVVTAYFQAILQNFTVTVSKVGNGTVSPDVGDHVYVENSEVTLTATETDPDYYFEKWVIDAVDETSNPYDLLVDEAKNVEARFLLLEPFSYYDDNFIPDTGNYVMRDLFEGTTIDLAKWTITNPQPTALIFSQNNVLKLFNVGIATTSFLANNIKSIASFATSGAMKFSVNASKVEGATIFGLYVDNNNRISFTVDSSTHAFVSYLVQAGVVRQQVILEAKLLCDTFKIVISAANLVTIWKWRGAWVQIGTDQTYSLGANKKFIASLTCTPSTMSYLEIDDVFISNTDFNTLNP